MRLYITEKPAQVVALKKVVKGNVLYAPLAGHILETWSPEDYDKELTLSNWHKATIEGKYPFFPKEFKKRVKPNSSFMMNGKKMTSDYKKKFAEAKEMIEKCSEIVLAADPDNEGVVLAMEVVEACNATKKVIGMINMAKLDPISLAKEIQIIDKIPYKKMNDAGNTRGIFDWLFGMNLSPIATIYLGGGKTIHMGGVKLPTIRMVVERDLAFESFAEIPFWELKGIARDPKTKIEFPITIKYDGMDRLDSEEIAKNAAKELSKIVKVSEYKETNKKSAPPKPYSLTDLQVEAGRLYKLNAKSVADIAQKLYANGDQSYPRTEENYYAEGQYAEIDQTISNLRSIDTFAKVKLNVPYLKRDIFNDKKLEGKAHTALCPTLQKANVDGMGDLDRKIYMLVATRYFIQFMEDYQYLNISIKANEGKFEISASENIEVFKGWKELSKGNDDDEVNAKRTFPTMSKGEDLEIVKIELKKGFTKPKPRFTEASLLKAMERISTIYDDPQVKEHLGENGIGTPATRATIIEDLKRDKKTSKGKTIAIEPYLRIEGGKVISTQKARDIIKLLPDEITSPVLRADLEAMTKSIVYKNADAKEVLKTIEAKIVDFVEKIKQVGKDNNIKISSGLSFDGISDKLVAFAQSIAKSMNVELDASTLEDKDKLKEFIEKNKNNLEYSFSEKQKAILEKIDDKKIQDLLKKSNVSKEEFDLGNQAIKDFFSKSMVFKLSDKQKAMFEKNKDKISKPVLDLIAKKDEFDEAEWKKVKGALDKLFKSFK